MELDNAYIAKLKQKAVFDPSEFNELNKLSLLSDGSLLAYLNQANVNFYYSDQFLLLSAIRDAFGSFIIKQAKKAKLVSIIDYWISFRCEILETVSDWYINIIDGHHCLVGSKDNVPAFCYKLTNQKLYDSCLIV